MRNRILAMIAVFAAWLALLSCMQPIGSSRVSSASVVTLLRVAQAEPCTSGDAEPCRYADRYEPSCSAFAVRGSRGLVMLVTAAHCAPFPLGTSVRYFAPNGVGHDRATLVALDATHDLAVLQPDNPAALRPLQRSAVPDEGARVMAISSLYRQSSLGAVVAPLGQGFYETTQSIVFGWSGAPVLDAQGRVWGLVSKCPVDEAQRCVAGHTYVASLEAL